MFKFNFDPEDAGPSGEADRAPPITELIACKEVCLPSTAAAEVCCCFFFFFFFVFMMFNAWCNSIMMVLFLSFLLQQIDTLAWDAIELTDNVVVLKVSSKKLLWGSLSCFNCLPLNAHICLMYAARIRGAVFKNTLLFLICRIGPRLPLKLFYACFILPGSHHFHSSQNHRAE